MFLCAKNLFKTSACNIRLRRLNMENTLSHAQSNRNTFIKLSFTMSKI